MFMVLLYQTRHNINCYNSRDHYQNCCPMYHIRMDVHRSPIVSLLSNQNIQGNVFRVFHERLSIKFHLLKCLTVSSITFVNLILLHDVNLCMMSICAWLSAICTEGIYTFNTPQLYLFDIHISNIVPTKWHR